MHKTWGGTTILGTGTTILPKLSGVVCLLCRTLGAYTCLRCPQPYRNVQYPKYTNLTYSNFIKVGNIFFIFLFLSFTTNIFIFSYVKRETKQTIDKESILKSKDNSALWVVSHCNAHSGRDRYVQEMQINYFIFT